ncbi:MAG: hypothetical protein KF832_28100 [Caldilineaceae bacterium]|nr:hypothetical protein [Caldilineaceae bacterium]
MKTIGLSLDRRWTVGVLVGFLVALSVLYTPVMLYEVAGITATTPAYACGPHSGGGC